MITICEWNAIKRYIDAATGGGGGGEMPNLIGDVTSIGNLTSIASGVITNDDINASAAIALSKLETNPLARANHTGTQDWTTLTGVPATLTTWSGITPAAGIGTFLATPTSANLAAAVTNETGSGSLVFATSPVLTTPALGTPSAVVLTNATGTAASLTAGNATKLATPRAINGVNFDGSGPITVPAAAGTLTGSALPAGVTGSSLTSLGTLTGLNVGGTNQVASFGSDPAFFSIGTPGTVAAFVGGYASSSASPSTIYFGQNSRFSSGTWNKSLTGLGCTLLMQDGVIYFFHSSSTTGESLGSPMLTITPAAITVAGAITSGGVAVPTISSADTLTNKRITKRVQSTASTATLTMGFNSYDYIKLTAQAAALTIGAPSGTPTDGQPMLLKIKDNGTARAITWNAAFRAMGVTLPTTTVISKILKIMVVYDSDDSKYDVISVAQEA